MGDILIFRMWRHPLSVLAVAGTTLAILLWPAIPLRGIEVWFKVFSNTPYLTTLYPIISVLSGSILGCMCFREAGILIALRRLRDLVRLGLWLEYC